MQVWQTHDIACIVIVQVAICIHGSTCLYIHILCVCVSLYIHAFQIVVLTTVTRVMVKQPTKCLWGFSSFFSCLSHTTEPLIHNTLSIMSAIESTNIGWTWGNVSIKAIYKRLHILQPVYPGIADGVSVESGSYNWECAQNAAKWDIVVVSRIGHSLLLCSDI